MNLNNLAKIVAIKEGKKKQISIAQVKEVMKCLLEEMALYDDGLILKIVKKYRRLK